MPQDRGTIHVSQALSNVAFGYKNAESIWDKVLPPVPVDRETDTYYLFTGTEFLRYYGRKRANGAKAARVASFSATTTTYTCDEHAYDDILTERTRNLADAKVNPEVRMTNNLMSIIENDIEVDVAAIVFGTTAYGSSTYYETVDAESKWDATNASGTPLLDVDAKKTLVQKAIGIEPNTMVVGKAVHDQLKRHPDLLEIYKYTGKGLLTKDQVRDALEIKNYLVGERIIVTSKQGQSTVTKDYVWGNYAALIYVPQNPAMEEPAFGYTFMHKLYGGLTAKVKKYRDESSDGDVIEAARSYVPKYTSQYAGYLFQSPVTA